MSERRMPAVKEYSIYVLTALDKKVYNTKEW